MAPAEAKLSGGIWPDGRKAVYLRMKQPVILFALLIALAAASCGRSESTRRLDAASELMCDHPDSALSILAAIDTATLSRDARARHALYTICARHKSGEEIDSTFDRFFNIVKDEFITSDGNKMENMLSYYYIGIRELECAHYVQAIINFLHAEEIAKMLHDNFQLGLIYENIAEAYCALFDNKTALNYSKKSLESFNKSDSPIHTHYALLDYGRMCNNALEFDESIERCEEVIKIAKECADRNLMAQAISIMGMSYCGKRDFEGARKTYDLFDTYNLPYSEANDIMLRGISYLYTGDLQKAREFADTLEILVPSEHTLKAKVLKAEHRYEEALDETIMLQEEIDESVRNLYIQDASFLLTKYYASQQTIAKEKVSHGRRNLFVVIIIAFLSLACLTMYYLFRDKKRRLTEFAFMQQINELTKELNSSMENRRILENELTIATSKNELAILKGKHSLDAVKMIFASKSELFNNLCYAYYVGSVTDNSKTKVYNQALQHIHALQNDNKTYLKLENSVNYYFDNLIEKLRASNLVIKENEIRMYVFIIAGMSNCAMGILFEKTPEDISRVKSRLKSKILKYDAQNDTDFSQYM